MEQSRDTGSEGLDAIRAALGEPYFASDSVLLYHGDCLRLMSAVPAKAFDLTITSPPYNIGKDYEDPLSLEAYVEWCTAWIGLVHDLTSGSGAFWLNLGYVSVPDVGHAVPLPYLLWDKVPFYLQQEVVWNYGAGVASRKRFSPRNEKFLWYVKNPSDYYFDLDAVRDPNVKYPNQMKNGKLKCNPLGKNPTDVWQFPKVTSGRNRSSKERTPHPAQFPAAVIDRIVRSCSGPTDLLLDPFMGSGTTAVAAASAGRRCVGFEVREDYCEIAAQRLSTETLRLFDNT